MSAQLTDEFKALVEEAKRLTPEETAELEAAFERQLRDFRDWVEPELRRRVSGALLFGGWLFADDPRRAGRFTLLSPDGLRVIISGSTYDDGRRWLHLSVSRSDRVPDWEDLKRVKSRFFGDETTAVQVFPPNSRWVNVHPYCLHLWRCLDGEPLPDFRERVGRVASI